MWVILRPTLMNKVTGEDSIPSTPTVADAFAETPISAEEAAASASLDSDVDGLVSDEEASDEGQTEAKGSEEDDGAQASADSDDTSADQIAELTASLHKAQGATETLQAQVDKLHQEKASMQTSIDGLETKLASAQEDNKHLRPLAERQVAAMSVQLNKAKPDTEKMSDVQLASAGTDLIRAVKAAFPAGVKAKTPSDQGEDLGQVKSVERKPASAAGF